MSDPGQSAPASREFVFRMIQRLMVIDIVGGAVLVLLGLFVLDLPALAIAGAFLACMGLGLVLLFGTLARRARAQTGRGGSPHELRR